MFVEDYYSVWRTGFAVLPRRVGDRWIWLSRYAWRPVQIRMDGPYP